MSLKLTAFSRQFLQYNLKVDGITEVVGVIQLFNLYLEGLIHPCIPGTFPFLVRFQRIFWKQTNLSLPNLVVTKCIG